MPSTSGDDNEDGPRPRPGPYCTEAGNSRANEGSDTNPDDNGNGSEYICASSTERCPHGSHTEPGNPTGHDNPDANARNPSEVSDAGNGIQEPHGGLSVAAVPEPTSDEGGTTGTNPRNLMSAFDISAGLGGTNDPNQRTCPRSDAPDSFGATDASRQPKWRS